MAHTFARYLHNFVSSEHSQRKAAGLIYFLWFRVPGRERDLATQRGETEYCLQCPVEVSSMAHLFTHKEPTDPQTDLISNYVLETQASINVPFDSTGVCLGQCGYCYWRREYQPKGLTSNFSLTIICLVNTRTILGSHNGFRLPKQTEPKSSPQNTQFLCLLRGPLGS